MATFQNRTSLPSPTFTDVSSASSYDLVSSRSRSPISSEDDVEEIVWAVARRRSRVSAGAISTTSASEDSGSDDDFVLLSPGRSSSSGVISGVAPDRPIGFDVHCPATPTALTLNLARISLNEPLPASTATTANSNGSITALETVKSGLQARSAPDDRDRTPTNRTESQPGLGERPIVDDFSESAADDAVSVCSQDSLYEEAVQFISLYLEKPEEYTSTSHRLTLLQSIIIELGLSRTSIPTSVKSAKAVLKSNAFVNVREYLAVREQGLEALQEIMHPSRSALARSIKTSRKRVPIRWIKKRGLDVFLVPCFYQ